MSTTILTDENRRTVARAIWSIRREEEDRCDMELEDMPPSHSVWAEADAAIGAIEQAVLQSPGVQALRKDAREAAETLATAIYKCAQKLGIANSDHSHLSVAQCLHLLDCIGGTAIPNGFDTESRWTKEHVLNYPEAAAECLNRLLGHEPPQFTSAHKTPYALPSHVMDDIRRYGNECVAFGRAEAIPKEIKP